MTVMSMISLYMAMFPGAYLVDRMCGVHLTRRRYRIGKSLKVSLSLEWNTVPRSMFFSK